MTTESSQSTNLAATTLQKARLQAGLSLRKLAAIAGTSHATLIAYENGTKSPTVGTFQRIIEAAGFAADVSLSPRVRGGDELPRGEELRQVLILAAQFPSTPNSTLEYPNLRDRYGPA